LTPGAWPRQLAAEGQGRARVSDALTRAIQWECVNLLDRDAVQALGSFDVILCRNVLIYFADATVVRVTEHLREALRHPGWLVVGTSESLLRFGTAFACEERSGSFFYRRRAE
jgi:chemotaxis protein methyltransferase CheR